MKIKELIDKDFIVAETDDEIQLGEAKGEISKEQLKEIGNLENFESGLKADRIQELEDEEKAGDINRKEEDVHENVMITSDDVGKTLSLKIKEVEFGMQELTETERSFLDSLLYDGFVRHTWFITENFPVVFRSVAPEAIARGYQVLREVRDLPEVIDNMKSRAILAVYLESFGPMERGVDSTPKGLPGAHESREIFESPEKIKERYTYISSNIDGTLTDSVQRRLIDFLAVLNRVSVAENITNF